MAFQKAVKRESKLRMAISGPAGAGKTWTALTLATRLANGESFAVIDTERGSASKYAEDFGFDTNELDNFDPRHYVKAIHEAEDAGYSVLVIDSLTHAWNGTGGLLDIVDAIARRKYSGNTFAAWKDATPLQNQLIDAITASKLHIIVTMRSKQEYSAEKGASGKTEVKKLGMAPIQRDGMEYEFDVVADMDIDNNMIIQKSRCSKLSGQIIPKPDKKVADTLKEWLRGAPVEEKASESKAPVATPNPAPAKAESEIETASEEQWQQIRSLCEQLEIEAPVNSYNTHQATNVIKGLQKRLDKKQAEKANESKPEQKHTGENLSQQESVTLQAVEKFQQRCVEAYGPEKGKRTYNNIRAHVVKKLELGDVPDKWMTNAAQVDDKRGN